MNSIEILLLCVPGIAIWFGSLFFVWRLSSPLVEPLYKHTLHDRSVPHPADPSYQSAWN